MIAFLSLLAGAALGLALAALIGVFRLGLRIDALEEDLVDALEGAVRGTIRQIADEAPTGEAWASARGLGRRWLQ